MKKEIIMDILYSTLYKDKEGKIKTRPFILINNEKKRRKEEKSFRKKIEHLSKEIDRLWHKKINSGLIEVIKEELFDNAVDGREFLDQSSIYKAMILAEVFCQPGTVESAVNNLIKMIEEKISNGRDYFFEVEYSLDEDPPQKIFFKKFNSTSPEVQLNQLVGCFHEMP